MGHSSPVSCWPDMLEAMQFAHLLRMLWVLQFTLAGLGFLWNLQERIAHTSAQ